PDRHLVDEPSEIELQLRDASGELVAPALQVDVSLIPRRQRSRKQRRSGAPIAARGSGPAAAPQPAEGGVSHLNQRPPSHGPKKLPVNFPPWQPAPWEQDWPCWTCVGARFAELAPSTFEAA